MGLVMRSPPFPSPFVPSEVEGVVRAKPRTCARPGLGFARPSVSTSLDTNGFGLGDEGSQPQPIKPHVALAMRGDVARGRPGEMRADHQNPAVRVLLDEAHARLASGLLVHV